MAVIRLRGQHNSRQFKTAVRLSAHTGTGPPASQAGRTCGCGQYALLLQAFFDLLENGPKHRPLLLRRAGFTSQPDDTTILLPVLQLPRIDDVLPLTPVC